MVRTRDQILEHLPADCLEVPSLKGLSKAAIEFITAFMAGDTMKLFRMDTLSIPENGICLVAAIYKINLFHKTKNYREIEHYIKVVERCVGKGHAIYDFAVTDIGPYGKEGYKISVMRGGEFNSKTEIVVRFAANCLDSKEPMTALQLVFDSVDHHIESVKHPYAAGKWVEELYESNFLYYQLFVLLIVEEENKDSIFDVMSMIFNARTAKNNKLVAEMYELAKTLDPDAEVMGVAYRRYWHMYLSPNNDLWEIIESAKGYVGCSSFQIPEFAFAAQVRFLILWHHTLVCKGIANPEAVIEAVEREFLPISEFIDANIGQAGKYAIYLEFHPKFQYYSIMLLAQENAIIRQQFLDICLKKHQITFLAYESFIMSAIILHSFVKLEQYDNALGFYFDNDARIAAGLNTMSYSVEYKIKALTAIANTLRTLGLDAYFLIISQWLPRFPTVPELVEHAKYANTIDNMHRTIIFNTTYIVGVVREPMEDERCTYCYGDYKVGMHFVKCRDCKKYIGHLKGAYKDIKGQLERFSVTCPYCRGVGDNQFKQQVDKLRHIQLSMERAAASVAAAIAPALVPVPAPAPAPVPAPALAPAPASGLDRIRRSQRINARSGRGPYVRRPSTQ